MKKILFKVLDYAVSCLMGAGTLLLVSLVVGSDWNMFIAMIVGMVLGLAVLLMLVLLFSFVSTPFELFPSGMLITMFTGMAAGMVTAMKAGDFREMFSIVILFSIFVQLMIDLYNIRLKGDQSVDQ